MIYSQNIIIYYYLLLFFIIIYVQFIDHIGLFFRLL